MAGDRLQIDVRQIVGDTLPGEALLGDGAGSPFAEAMRAALPSVEALTEDVERHYKRTLE